MSPLPEQLDQLEQRAGHTSDTPPSDAPSIEGREAPDSRCGPTRPWERRFFRRMLRSLGDPPLAMRFWDGQQLEPAAKSPVGTLVIQDRRTLLKLVWDPLFQFGEAYSDGRLRVEGDLVQVLDVVYRCIQQGQSAPSLTSKMARWLMPRRGNSQRRSRENIHHHYDIGNDFYKLWLDDDMLYTCAYFEQPGVTLEEAQRGKMDHVCRKLWLHSGDVVCEAGCGWGGLAIHMAKHYGARVRAYNISREQLEYARQRAAREGLSDRVEFIEDDWRNIRGPCDVFVSVGMLEHVGRRNYGELGKVIRRCLTPDGRGLLHSIGQNLSQPLNPWIERRIFPGAYPPTLSEMMEICEPHELSVLDVENLRLHYMLTLQHWLQRFEHAQDEVRSEFGERFVKMWRLYLSGSTAAFSSGSLQLFQLLVAPAESNANPWTRAHQYKETRKWSDTM